MNSLKPPEPPRWIDLAPESRNGGCVFGWQTPVAIFTSVVGMIFGLMVLAKIREYGLSHPQTSTELGILAVWTVFVLIAWGYRAKAASVDQLRVAIAPRIPAPGDIVEVEIRQLHGRAPAHFEVWLTRLEEVTTSETPRKLHNVLMIDLKYSVEFRRWEGNFFLPTDAEPSRESQLGIGVAYMLDWAIRVRMSGTGRLALDELYVFRVESRPVH